MTSDTAATFAGLNHPEVECNACDHRGVRNLRRRAANFRLYVDLRRLPRRRAMIYLHPSCYRLRSLVRRVERDTGRRAVPVGRVVRLLP